MSSGSVRCTPSFFSPMVRSLTQIPPSPFTSRTWNSTLSLCSCSGPPHMSHGWSDWPGSDSPATGRRVSGLDGDADELSSACPPPLPGSTPARHWQNTSPSRGGMSEPCWCIINSRASVALCSDRAVRAAGNLSLQPRWHRHMSLHFTRHRKQKA